MRFFKPEQNTMQWQSFTVTQSIFLENDEFNRGRDRIQTPAFSSRIEHSSAKASFLLVTQSTLQKMATSSLAGQTLYVGERSTNSAHGNEANLERAVVRTGL